MNWTNYRRLVDYLTTMDPAFFNYDNPRVPSPNDRDQCGCLAVCIARMTGANIGRWTEEHDFVQFLGVTMAEAKFLYGNGLTLEEVEQAGEDGYISTDVFDLKGAQGIAEAIQRLAHVAARYGGEPAPAPVYQPDDAAFLASVRALINAPLVGDEA